MQKRSLPSTLEMRKLLTAVLIKIYFRNGVYFRTDKVYPLLLSARYLDFHLLPLHRNILHCCDYNYTKFAIVSNKGSTER